MTLKKEIQFTLLPTTLEQFLALDPWCWSPSSRATLFQAWVTPPEPRILSLLTADNGLAVAAMMQEMMRNPGPGSKATWRSILEGIMPSKPYADIQGHVQCCWEQVGARGHRLVGGTFWAGVTYPGAGQAWGCCSSSSITGEPYLIGFTGHRAKGGPSRHGPQPRAEDSRGPREWGQCVSKGFNDCSDRLLRRRRLKDTWGKPEVSPSSMVCIQVVLIHYTSKAWVLVSLRFLVPPLRYLQNQSLESGLENHLSFPKMFQQIFSKYTKIQHSLILRFQFTYCVHLPVSKLRSYTKINRRIFKKCGKVLSLISS